MAPWCAEGAKTFREAALIKDITWIMAHTMSLSLIMAKAINKTLTTQIFNFPESLP